MNLRASGFRLRSARNLSRRTSPLFSELRNFPRKSPVLSRVLFGELIQLPAEFALLHQQINDEEWGCNDRKSQQGEQKPTHFHSIFLGATRLLYPDSRTRVLPNLALYRRGYPWELMNVT